jgi:hypothetical protein
VAAEGRNVERSLKFIIDCVGRSPSREQDLKYLSAVPLTSAVHWRLAAVAVIVRICPSMDELRYLCIAMTQFNGLEQPQV